jgi:hypothetical protein
MSRRGTHYAGGAVLGLAAAQASIWAGMPIRDALALAAVSTITGGGELSPDVDQRKWFRTLDRWLPDEWLGGGGPLQHRGVTHWTAWPPILAIGWAVAIAFGPPILGRFWWIGYGVALGWASHAILDALYGHAVHTPEGMIVVRRGVPTMPWWRHRAGIWTSSGIGSQTAGIVLTLVAAGQAWLIVTGST